VTRATLSLDDIGLIVTQEMQMNKAQLIKFMQDNFVYAPRSKRGGAMSGYKVMIPGQMASCFVLRELKVSLKRSVRSGEVAEVVKAWAASSSSTSSHYDFFAAHHWVTSDNKKRISLWTRDTRSIYSLTVAGENVAVEVDRFAAKAALAKASADAAKKAAQQTLPFVPTKQKVLRVPAAKKSAASPKNIDVLLEQLHKGMAELDKLAAEFKRSMSK
jgi:hypothetical protein